MMETKRFLVVVSFFEPRSSAHLQRLLSDLLEKPAGTDFDILVVVNRTSSEALQFSTPLGDVVKVLERPNEGMNIGAWDHAWRSSPNYEGYLFLQDECELKCENWLSPFVTVSDKPGIGLVGESWNAGWERPWDIMRSVVEGQTMHEHTIHGDVANRVDVYIAFMNQHGVDIGKSAGHLRSLVWFASRKNLLAMDGFLHGANYGECIAAEIAATKRVESLGLKAVQVDLEPFRYFGHVEWRKGSTGRWQHGHKNASLMSFIKDMLSAGVSLFRSTRR